jgi:hypothetical protein
LGRGGDGGGGRNGSETGGGSEDWLGGEEERIEGLLRPREAERAETDGWAGEREEEGRRDPKSAEGCEPASWLLLFDEYDIELCDVGVVDRTCRVLEL